MIFLNLAWRNILRSGRRTAATVSAIALGLGSLIFIWGFVDGMNEQMLDNSTRYLAGHLQVHLKGYHEEQSAELVLDEGALALQRVAREPRVAAVSRRFEGRAIAATADRTGSAEKSRGVKVVGVEPVEETRVTTLHEAVKAGAPLNSDTEGVLIGDALAEALGLAVGGELVLLGQAVDGSIAAGRFPVTGIFDAGNDMIDAIYVFLPLEQARELFAAPGSVTSLVARLDDRRDAGEIAARLEKALGSEYEVLDWPRLLPGVMQSVQFHEVVGYIIVGILFIIVAVGVTNTVLMAALERTRELGVMMALGTTVGQTIRLILFEALYLGLLGLIIGVMAGVAVTAWLGARGIDMGAYARAVETMPGLSAVIHPLLLWDRVLLISLVVFATSVVAALYPAWKTGLLRPVEAIRGVGRAAAGRSREISRALRHLPIFQRIAARSIARNPRRTALTMAASTAGVGAFVFLYGFAEGYLAQLVDNATGYVTGHLQLQHRDFRRELAPQWAIAQPAQLLARLRADTRIEAAAPRVQAQALISSANQSQGVLLVGVDPDAERDVTFIHRTVVSGKPLAGGQNREILLGRKLAERLNSRLGEKVVVMVQASDGTLGSAAYRVGGIFATESEAFDAAFAFVTLPAAQTLLGMGDRVSALAIRLRDRAELEEVKGSLPALFGAAPYTAVDWQELMPEVSQMIGMVRANFLLVVVIVFAVVAIGIMNTLLMSVMERTREFGILLALGTPPGAVVRTVLYESAILSAAGMVIGFAGGAVLVVFYGARGIDLSGYAGGLATIPGMTNVVYPHLALAQFVAPIALLYLLSVLAAGYPAWRAARLNPVTAIRHV